LDWAYFCTKEGREKILWLFWTTDSPRAKYPRKPMKNKTNVEQYKLKNNEILF